MANNADIREAAISVFLSRSINEPLKRLYIQFMTVQLKCDEMLVFKNYRDRLYWILWTNGELPSYSLMFKAVSRFEDIGLFSANDITSLKASTYYDICRRQNNLFMFTYNSMMESFNYFNELVRLDKIEKPIIKQIENSERKYDNNICRRFPEQYHPKSGKVPFVRSVRSGEHVYGYAHLFYRYMDILGITGIECTDKTERSSEVIQMLYITSKDIHSSESSCDTMFLKERSNLTFYGFINSLNEWIKSENYPDTILKNVMTSMDYEACRKYNGDVSEYTRYLLNYIVRYLEAACDDIRPTDKLQHVKDVLIGIGVDTTVRSFEMENLQIQMEINNREDPYRHLSSEQIRHMVWSGWGWNSTYFVAGDYSSNVVFNSDGEILYRKIVEKNGNVRLVPPFLKEYIPEEERKNYGLT